MLEFGDAATTRSQPNRRRVRTRPKKSSKGKWIGLAVTALLAVGAFLFLKFKDSGTKGVSSIPTQPAPAKFGLSKPAGQLIVWGNNKFGELAAFPTDNDVVAVSSGGPGGGHNLALKSDGTVIAWGKNDHGQCDVPPTLDRVVAIAQGYHHSLALREDGTVVQWGESSDLPGGLENISAISANARHSMALTKDGQIVSWGSDSLGALAVPPVTEPITAIASGLEHRVALTNSGEIIAWGSNTEKQTEVPVFSSPVRQIVCGAYHTVALLADGTLKAWGLDRDGQTNTPPGNTFVEIAAAGHGSAALNKDGQIEGWGLDQGHSIPADLSDVTALSLGWSHGVAVSTTASPPAPQSPGSLSFELLRDLGGADITALASHQKQFAAIVGSTLNVYDDLSAVPKAIKTSRNSPLTALALSESHVVATNAEGELLIGEALRSTPWVHRVPTSSALTACAISPDGTRIAVGNEKGEVLLFDFAGKKLGQSQFHEGAVADAAFMDRRTFVTAGADAVVCVWDISGDVIDRIQSVRTHHQCRSLAIGAQADVLVSSAMGGLTIASPDPWRVTASWLGHGLIADGLPGTELESVCHPAFTPDGTRIISAGQDGNVRVWDRKSGVLLGQSEQLSHPVRDLVMLSDGTAVSCQGSQLCLWKPLATTPVTLEPTTSLQDKHSIDPSIPDQPADAAPESDTGN